MDLIARAKQVAQLRVRNDPTHTSRVHLQNLEYLRSLINDAQLVVELHNRLLNEKRKWKEYHTQQANSPQGGAKDDQTAPSMSPTLSDLIYG